MGIKKWDKLNNKLDEALNLLAEGKPEEVVALINDTLKKQIKEERVKVAGEENTWYFYKCQGCTLGCEASFKFEPQEKYLKDCSLDGSKEADYVQYDSRTDVSGGVQ